jgi:hypothetical protein
MLDEHLFRQQMVAAYREIAPEAGPSGEFLIRRLATALYNRGARIDIGSSLPLEKHLIHQSVGPDLNFMWVGKRWAQAMGVRPHAMIGKHVSTALTPDSLAAYLEHFWPTLHAKGKAEDDIVLVTSSGVPIEGHAKGEALLDSEGSFMRTFTRITVFLPRVGAFLPLG